MGWGEGLVGGEAKGDWICVFGEVEYMDFIL